MLYISEHDSWPIIVEAQGKHNIPVDTVEINKLFQTEFREVVIDELKNGVLRSIDEARSDRVERSIFSNGNWQLNVDRTRLAGSPERNGTMRVYDSEVSNSAFVIIQLQNGERRKALLHPPKDMTKREKLECIMFLSLTFTDFGRILGRFGGPSETALEEAAAFARSIPKEEFCKKIVSPEARIVRDCQTAFRSKQRKLRFIELFCEMGGDIDVPISELVSSNLFDRFWLEIRSNKGLAANSVTRAQLYLVAQSTGLIEEAPSGNAFRMGEVAEVYFAEYKDLVEQQREEKLLAERKDLDKAIERLAKRKESLELDLNNTSKKLEEARQLRKNLS